MAGTTFYHQGSANLIYDALHHTEVDVFLAGIAGRSFTRDYWARILPRLQPAQSWSGRLEVPHAQTREEMQRHRRESVFWKSGKITLGLPVPPHS